MPSGPLGVPFFFSNWLDKPFSVVCPAVLGCVGGDRENRSPAEEDWPIWCALRFC